MAKNYDYANMSYEKFCEIVADDENEIDSTRIDAIHVVTNQTLLKKIALTSRYFYMRQIAASRLHELNGNH